MRKLYPQTPADIFADTYNLKIKSDKCPKCKTTRTADIPFIAKGYRGLESELHECGSRYQLRVFRITGDMNDWLDEEALKTPERKAQDE